MPFLGSQPAEAALTTGSLGDDIVTLAKIASGTDGELITWDASGNPAAVAAGTSGHFLKSQGAGSVPVFAAAGASTGNLVHIASAAPSTSVSIVQFTNAAAFDSTYDHLVLRVRRYYSTSAGYSLYLRMMTGGTPSADTGSNYRYAHSGTYQSGAAQNLGSASATAIWFGGSNNNADNGLYGDYSIMGANLTNYTTINGIQNYFDNTPGFFNHSMSGVYTQTTANTGLELHVTSGYIRGEFDLFGVVKE